MFCLLPRVTLERLGNFGISLAVGLTAHRQVHAHFAALAGKMRSQTLEHLFVYAFGHADHMFIGPRQRFSFDHFLKFRRGLFTLRTKFGSCIPFVNITANRTNKFLFHSHQVFK